MPNRNGMTWELLHENERPMFAPALWSMYATSYGSIGLMVDNADDILREYDLWWILFDAEGRPRAFRVGKRTNYGIKMGLSGTDGTRESKRALIKAIPTWMQQRGLYGEVSHRMEEIMSRAGVPVVCAQHAERILRKPLVPLDDGIHYVRDIQGIGPVTKVLVGRPLGIPTTSYDHPRCNSSFGGLVSDGMREATSPVADRLEADDSLAPWLDG